MARPSKLTPELIEDMSAKVKKGLPVCYVCDMFSIHETTYHEWMKLGEQDDLDGIDSLYSQFWRSIKKSYAQYVEDTMDTMRERLNGWQSLAWWLERTNSRFMPKQQIQADDDGKVTVVIGGKEKQPKKL